MRPERRIKPIPVDEPEPPSAIQGENYSVIDGQYFREKAVERLRTLPRLYFSNGDNVIAGTRPERMIFIRYKDGEPGTAILRNTLNMKLEEAPSEDVFFFDFAADIYDACIREEMLPSRYLPKEKIN
jgi:hypothetical protein